MPAKYQGNETIHGKTVVITGANTGIGKETARELARRGGRIIMACRSVDKAEEARQEIVEDTKNEDVVVQKLDLSSFESIREFAANFNATESRLDILINNAGVTCPKRWETKDGLEMQIGTNHFGHFLLTNLLLDKLKACSPSRILNVSSAGHYYGTIRFDDFMSERSYGQMKAYSQSKLANVLHANELARRLEGTGVTANSLHPGGVATDLGRNNKDSRLYKVALALFGRFLISSADGAQTTLYCALDPSLEQVSGRYYDNCKVKREARKARNVEDAKRLWELTEEIIQQKSSAQS